MASFFYMGHGSYKITLDEGVVIYVDPFAGERYDVPANIILVTHEHGDHTCIEKVTQADNCVILRAYDMHPDKDTYLTRKVYGVTIQAVEACNSFHPREECVGYVVSFEDCTFYASGDTSITEDMRSGRLSDMDLDWAVLPSDGYYTMNEDEVLECVRLIQAKHTIPIHMVPVHDMAHPVLYDEEKASFFQSQGLITIKPGDSIRL